MNYVVSILLNFLIVIYIIAFFCALNVLIIGLFKNICDKNKYDTYFKLNGEFYLIIRFFSSMRLSDNTISGNSFEIREVGYCKI